LDRVRFVPFIPDFKFAPVALFAWVWCGCCSIEAPIVVAGAVTSGLAVVVVEVIVVAFNVVLAGGMSIIAGLVFPAAAAAAAAAAMALSSEGTGAAPVRCTTSILDIFLLINPFHFPYCAPCVF
jgi:hypothetical protein